MYYIPNQIETLRAVNKAFNLKFELPAPDQEYTQERWDDLVQRSLDAIERIVFEQQSSILDTDDFAVVPSALFNLYFCHLESFRVGIGYGLELRSMRPWVTDVTYPSIWNRLVSIELKLGFNLKRENAGQGYHFHYLERSRRANFILLFDPREPVTPPDTLYWEYHSHGIDLGDPDRFHSKTKAAIHSTAQSTLRSVGKFNFRRLSKDSHFFAV